EHKERLSASKDHYVFHLHRFTNQLLVREIPSLELDRINRETPQEKERAARIKLEKVKRLQAIAKERQPDSRTSSESRARRGVVAVEGNLIRADFQKKTDGERG